MLMQPTHATPSNVPASASVAKHKKDISGLPNTTKGYNPFNV